MAPKKVCPHFPIPCGVYSVWASSRPWYYYQASRSTLLWTQSLLETQIRSHTGPQLFVLYCPPCVRCDLPVLRTSHLTCIGGWGWVRTNHARKRRIYSPVALHCAISPVIWTAANFTIGLPAGSSAIKLEERDGIEPPISGLAGPGALVSLLPFRICCLLYSRLCFMSIISVMPFI